MAVFAFVYVNVCVRACQLKDKAGRCVLTLPQGVATCISHSLRKHREDMHLHKTQLCTVMGDCGHLRKGSCKFAHALDELRPAPATWTTTKGHYWEQGKPLPAQDILDLIERYAAISSARQLPEWVQYLRAHREEAKQEEDGAPQKKGSRRGLKAKEGGGGNKSFF